MRVHASEVQGQLYVVWWLFCYRCVMLFKFSHVIQHILQCGWYHVFWYTAILVHKTSENSILNTFLSISLWTFCSTNIGFILVRSLLGFKHQLGHDEYCGCGLPRVWRPNSHIQSMWQHGYSVQRFREWRHVLETIRGQHTGGIQWWRLWRWRWPLLRNNLHRTREQLSLHEDTNAASRVFLDRNM